MRDDIGANGGFLKLLYHTICLNELRILDCIFLRL